MVTKTNAYEPRAARVCESVRVRLSGLPLSPAASQHWLGGRTRRDGTTLLQDPRLMWESSTVQRGGEMQPSDL